MENAEAAASSKKRKRPWRKAVRRAAKQAKLEELTASETPESKKQLEELQKTLQTKKQERRKKRVVAEKEKNDKVTELENKLAGSRFRSINEKLYTINTEDAVQLFQENPDEFAAYHRGYRVQVKKWPMNPVDHILQLLAKKPKGLVIADLGCGDAKIARKLGSSHTVHSFDLVSNNSFVQASDMANLPLEAESVDIAVYCLSLMGTNLADIIREGHRILKNGGKIYIAEVRSRFRSVSKFLAALRELGFEVLKSELCHDYFQLITIKKVGKIKKKRPTGLVLDPCYYKRR